MQATYCAPKNRLRSSDASSNPRNPHSRAENLVSPHDALFFTSASAATSARCFYLRVVAASPVLVVRESFNFGLYRLRDPAK
jgi:hypothetical protein